MTNEFSLRFPQPVNTAIDWTTGLEKLSGALLAKKERERQLARDAEYARQNDLNEQRLKLQDVEHQQDRANKYAQQDGDATKGLLGLMGQGAYSEAQAMAEASRYSDPRTGQMRGPSVDAGDPGKAPDMTPDMAGFMKAVPVFAGVQESIESQPGLENFGKAIPIAGTGRAARKPSVTTADGRRIEIDPTERDRKKHEQDQQRKDRAMALLSDPTFPKDPAIQKRLMLEAGLMGAGVDNVARQGMGAVENREDTQAFTGDQNDKARANAVRLKSMKGSGKGPNRAQSADDRGYNALAGNLLNQELSRDDYKEILRDVRDTKLMINGLESDNPAAQKRSLGIWAKQASGPGAVQQSERDEFVNTIGGQDERLKALALKWLQDGSAPPEQRKIFAAAARDIMLRHQTELLSEVQGSVRNTFASHPDPKMQKFADWAAGNVGGSYLPKRGPGGAAVASGPDDARKAKLLDFAKKNPGDPRSKVILKKYGGQ